MRWSIIRLIWLRELRDQLRDRRTVFMIAVLPILLYPILGIGVMEFALGYLKKPSVIGIIGARNLPALDSSRADWNPLPAVAWFSLTPTGSAAADGLTDRLLAAATLAYAGQLGLGQDYPPLLLFTEGRASFPPTYLDGPGDA